MTTLSIRIEEKAKKEAQKTLKLLGLDLSSAVNMFLNQVVAEQGIPFKPSRTPKQIRAEWDKEVKEALKTKGYKDVDEMFKALNLKANV
ncbi:MAG: type II toxin-antitoxin system RelB/DinJ family antitoxin [Candidatus Paceibacterota bacterium]|jgi:DNA-damage-inducible protein J